ncbi:MAG TPA: CerR family C-terminal domain-containing protein [Steroidobacteraceae bacterium]|nr:CerR family C-terminal domain-containing protein [Steroidobacteraceae bacterium]
MSSWKLCVKWNTFARMGTMQGNALSHAGARAAPRRHPRKGGYARGEETRARIIATALQIFGDQGYDQASTRQIAASAGVNPPALQYYFDSKEGLYRACVQTILDRVLEVLAPSMQRAQAVIRARTRSGALEALLGLLDALADALVAAGAEAWSRFIARGKADGSVPAMTMIRERVSTPLRVTVCELIGLILREPSDSEQTRLRGLTIMGQVSMCHANRQGTLAALGWQQFDARGIAAMKAVVRAHTTAALESPACTGLPSGRRASVRKQRG